MRDVDICELVLRQAIDVARDLFVLTNYYVRYKRFLRLGDNAATLFIHKSKKEQSFQILPPTYHQIVALYNITSFPPRLRPHGVPFPV